MQTTKRISPRPAPTRRNFSDRIRVVKNSVRARFEKYDLMSFQTYFLNIFSNTSFVVLFAISGFLIFNHSTASLSYISKISKFLHTKLSISTHTSCEFTKLFVQCIPFIPAVLSVRDNQRIITGLVSLAYVTLVPEQTPYEFLIQGFLLLAFMRTNVTKYKMYIVLIMVIVYAGQFTVPFKFVYDTCPNSTESTTTSPNE